MVLDLSFANFYSSKMGAYSKYRNYTEGQAMPPPTIQIDILKKFNIVAPSDITKLTNSQLETLRNSINSIKTDNLTKLEVLVIEYWEWLTDKEFERRGEPVLGGGNTLSILTGGVIAPSGSKSRTTLQNGKWPVWKIAAVGAGGLAVTGLLIFAIYKVSKNKK